MIRVRDLKKRYGQFEAVKGISFDISSGEVIGFLGPNGAGKTTTMRMLTGFLGKSEGTITIDGQSLDADPEAAKAKIGYLPENNPLYEDMTPVEYLTFIGQMRGMEPDRLRTQVEKNLLLYGLREVATKDIGELSKGYRQRVGLARAAIDDPPILVLDEPTSGLDPNQIIEIRNLIKEIGKKKTVILSTHNLSEVEATCNRIIIINRGTIVADDSTDAIDFKGSGGMLHVKIRGEGAIPEALGAIPGVREVIAQSAEGDWSRFDLKIGAVTGEGQLGEQVFDAAVANGWKIAEMRVESASLEDVFALLTQGDEKGSGE